MQPGKCLVRWSGTAPPMTDLAKKNATAIGAGHSFVVFLGDGFFPLNVLNTLKMVPEVCRIFCATANPTEVVLAETEQGDNDSHLRHCSLMSRVLRIFNGRASWFGCNFAKNPSLLHPHQTLLCISLPT